MLAPALAAIRGRFPGATMTVACHSGAARLMREAGLADDALSQDDMRLLPLFGATANESSSGWTLGPFDLAAAWLRDPAGTVATALRAWGAEQAIIAPSLPEPGAGQHVVEHIFATLAALGLTPADAPPVPLLRAPDDDAAWTREYLARIGVGNGAPLVLHPGSGGSRKNWPPSAFAAVADLLAGDYEVLVIGGPADDEAVAATLAACRRKPVHVRDLSLGRLAALLTRCAAYLGNDSGVSHLAALLGVPTVALFGPTDPALWRPYGERVMVLRWEGQAGELAAKEVAAALRWATERWYVGG